MPHSTGPYLTPKVKTRMAKPLPSVESVVRAVLPDSFYRVPADRKAATNIVRALRDARKNGEIDGALSPLVPEDVVERTKTAKNDVALPRVYLRRLIALA